MRSMFLPTLAVAGLLSLPVLAEDAAKPHEPKVQCAIHAKDGSRAVQGKDLIVDAGEKIKDAIAVDGNILIRKGAVVEDVISIRGRITIEEGARVNGDVVALGGTLHLGKNVQVKGDAVALGGSLQMEAGSAVGGDKVSLSIVINGDDLAKSFLEKALKGSDCQLSFDEGEDEDESDDSHDEQEDQDA